MTVNGYTQDEDFEEAALVVSSLGDPGGPSDARARQPERSAARCAWVTLDDLEACLGEAVGGIAADGRPMSEGRSP